MKKICFKKLRELLLEDKPSVVDDGLSVDDSHSLDRPQSNIHLAMYKSRSV